jgi:uncharacterized protein YndB with AHSA1/START domain
MIELTPNQRIVQAWRAEHWAHGVYSIVRLDLTAHELGTRVVLEQAGFPLEHRALQEINWRRLYWQPLEEYFWS